MRNHVSPRRKKSGGQALVLVTVALVAMSGMLGLAIDLGWMFFLHKQAQAAADAAALAVVKEVLARNGGSQGIACGTNNVLCSSFTPLDCNGGIAATSNLYNGCLYAQRNGFNFTSPQKVTIAAGTPASPGMPPTVTGIQNNALAYWATARAVQTVPQLFSAVLGNTTGVVSAIATAGIVGVVNPGSFIAMDQRGDCMSDGSKIECGVDMDVQGNAAACPGTVWTGTVCASSGAQFDSTCDGQSLSGCGTQAMGTTPTTTGTSFAGQLQGSNAALGGPFLDITGTCPGMGCPLANGKNQCSSTPCPGYPTNLQTNTNTDDPTKNLSQPPILFKSQAMPCGILAGTTLSGTKTTPLKLGAYNYFSYTSISAGGFPVIAANSTSPITLGDNVTFDPTNGVCPGQNFGQTALVSAQSGSSFPTYFFWGGMNVAGSVTFTAGQYVAVGTASTTGSTFSISGSSKTITCSCDANGGMIVITTTPDYPGVMSTQDTLHSIMDPAVNAYQYQGNLNIQTGKSTSVTMDGIQLDNLPTSAASMIPYNGYLIWQDRRNSEYDLYDQSSSYRSYSSCTACTGVDRGVVVGTVFDDLSNCSPSCWDGLKGYTGWSSGGVYTGELAANHVTPTSGGFIYQAATQLSLNGTIYMPRGAWLNYQGSPSVDSALKIITGAILMQGGGNVTLLPLNNPTITFVAALIQ